MTTTTTTTTTGRQRKKWIDNMQENCSEMELTLIKDDKPDWDSCGWQGMLYKT